MEEMITVQACNGFQNRVVIFGADYAAGVEVFRVSSWVSCGYRVDRKERIFDISDIGGVEVQINRRNNLWVERFRLIATVNKCSDCGEKGCIFASSYCLVWEVELFPRSC